MHFALEFTQSGSKLIAAELLVRFFTCTNVKIISQIFVLVFFNGIIDQKRINCVTRRVFSSVRSCKIWVRLSLLRLLFRGNNKFPSYFVGFAQNLSGITEINKGYFAFQGPHSYGVRNLHRFGRLSVCL